MKLKQYIIYFIIAIALWACKKPKKEAPILATITYQGTITWPPINYDIIRPPAAGVKVEFYEGKDQDAQDYYSEHRTRNMPLEMWERKLGETFTNDSGYYAFQLDVRKGKCYGVRETKEGHFERIAPSYNYIPNILDTLTYTHTQDFDVEPFSWLRLVIKNSPPVALSDTFLLHMESLPENPIRPFNDQDTVIFTGHADTTLFFPFLHNGHFTNVGGAGIGIWYIWDIYTAEERSKNLYNASYTCPPFDTCTVYIDY